MKRIYLGWFLIFFVVWFLLLVIAMAQDNDFDIGVFNAPWVSCCLAAISALLPLGIWPLCGS
jgi:hypothetical protein